MVAVVLAPVVRALAETLPPGEKPKYARYRPKSPVRCDECMHAFVDNPSAPLARMSRYSRRTSLGSHLVLCHDHTNVWRERDGLEAIKAKKPAA